jgi:hypothetical protein
LYADGNTYMGQFMHDKQHGYGIYRWRNGDVHYGLYKEGDRDGYGYYCRQDGLEYYGQYKDDKRHGEGVYKEDGKIYKVKYAEGKLIEKTEM